MRLPPHARAPRGSRWRGVLLIVGAVGGAAIVLALVLGAAERRP